MHPFFSRPFHVSLSHLSRYEDLSSKPSTKKRGKAKSRAFTRGFKTIVHRDVARLISFSLFISFFFFFFLSFTSNFWFASLCKAKRSENESYARDKRASKTTCKTTRESYACALLNSFSLTHVKRNVRKFRYPIKKSRLKGFIYITSPIIHSIIFLKYMYIKLIIFQRLVNHRKKIISDS